jgi:diguanylate cyclase (GGDEF)-like protein
LRIEEVRPSFTVYLIASEQDRLSGLGEALGLAGYMVASFTELTAAFSELVSNPPHFILFDFLETKFNVKKAVKQINAQLPESHVFMVTPVLKREEAAPMLEQGVADMILTPLASPLELVRALDRSAERDYFMYMNEKLAASASSGAGEEESPEPTSAGFSQDFHLDYARRLFDQKNGDECISVFLQSVSGALGSAPAVYFKYIANRRVLAAALSHGLTDVDITGIGLNFNEINPSFRTSHLRDPMGLDEVTSLVKEVFAAEDFFAIPVEAFGEILGVAVFLKPEPSPSLLGMLRDWMMLLNRALSLIEAEKRLHVMCVKDPATDVYTRQIFLEKSVKEVSRARRTSLPVSLALISIDQYGQIVSKAGQEEAQTLLKMVARIFEKHSRVNDIIGRTGADEFGIILPHTGKQGALIKAERLRRIIESADFKKVLSAFPQITISLGVAEYPSMVRDAEELVQMADEALFQVRKEGNKTCVAKAPEGFVADFEVHEKGV